MNEKNHLTLRQLSLYYDGLLEKDEAEAIASQLNGDKTGQETLRFFEGIDDSLQPELSEDEIGDFLGDTLKNVHERLIEEDRHTRTERQSIFDWFFAPRNLIGALAGTMLLFAIFTSIDPRHIFNPVPEDEPAVASAVQKEAIIAAAEFTKSVFGTGVEYAKSKAEPLGDSIALLPDRSTDVQQDESGDPTAEASIASKLLNRSDTQQIALGMGVSVLSMASVF